jgi:hypothetical protein
MKTSISGYAYALTGESTWRTAEDDDWDTVLINASGRQVGHRYIDGVLCKVYQCGGSRYYAVTYQSEYSVIQDSWL